MLGSSFVFKSGSKGEEFTSLHWVLDHMAQLYTAEMMCNLPRILHKARNP
uniref:Uncharacterized protein n=1 Tax=Arion vulgaris TaxID=1028688 RepID=A0A0B6YQY9_9EUPU